MIDVYLASYKYLEKAYELAQNSSSSTFSVILSPFIVGETCGLNKKETITILKYLSQKKLVTVFLGYTGMILHPIVIDYLEQHKMEIIDSFDAYYIELDEYKKLIKQKNKFDPHYNCYLKVEIIKEIGVESMICRIRGKGWRYEYISQKNAYQNGIIKDYENGKKALFTLDKRLFYELESCRVNSNGIYEFTLTKYRNMGKDSNGFNINSGNNSPISIINNSPNSTQNVVLTESRIESLVNDLKKHQKELIANLASDQREELIIAVNYLENQNKKGRTSLIAGIVDSIKDIIKGVPTEIATTLLSDSSIKLLGLG